MSTHNKLLDATASDDCSDDSDYAPPSPKASGSKRPASAASDNESSKRAKLDAEEADAKKEAAEAWASIMSVEEEAKKEREKALELKTDEDLVEVSRPRNFAGEVVYETVRLPATHPDAIKYGTVQKAESSSSAPAAARPRPVVRRKPRQSLESMDAAIRAGAKKMSTIEKSAMDWKAHTASADATTQAELEAHRKRGGGSYLEKQDLLARLGDAKEKKLEQIKERRR